MSELKNSENIFFSRKRVYSKICIFDVFGNLNVCRYYIGIIFERYFDETLNGIMGISSSKPYFI